MTAGSGEFLEPADHVVAVFTVALRVVGFIEMVALVVASVSLRLNLRDQEYYFYEVWAFTISRCCDQIFVFTRAMRIFVLERLIRTSVHPLQFLGSKWLVILKRVQERAGRILLWGEGIVWQRFSSFQAVRILM